MSPSNDEIVPAGQPSPSDQPLTAVDQKKAHGRTLRDVRGDRQFSPAELRLLKASAEGTIAQIADSMPEARSEENFVRPGLIRFIALGGDASTPVHERGIAIVGAWIEGSIDLEGCEVVCPVSIANCNIAGDLILRDGKMSSLNLGGTTVNHIIGDRLTCSGSILLRYNFHAKGMVRFPRAWVKGDLELMGATIDGHQLTKAEGKIALFCAGIEIGGGVLARSGKQSFLALGVVYFHGAKIGGNFVFSNATFAAGALYGLGCENTEIGGAFFLENVTLAGQIRLNGIETRGDLQFFRCKFEEGSRLILTRAQVKGRLVFREITGALNQIVLRGARADSLVDDVQSWSVAEHITLDGFQYERILDIGFLREGKQIHFASPVSAKARIEWLQMQNELDLGKDFKPQPWEQLAKVLLGMGHDDDARAVAIEKQKYKRRAWLVQSRLNKDGLAKRLRLLWLVGWHWIYGILSRYGYRPSLLIGWAFLIALLFAVSFELAGQAGIMAPTDRTVVASALYDHCRPNNWTKCTELSGKYPPFDPIIYSIDLILPVIATQHVREWAPLTTKADGRTWRLGVFVWALSRIENLIGWILGLMFVATVAGLIKKD